jgi:catechol 2,3-dioxygenase-like lactoylglutathione lyase family enzyme
MQQTGTGIKQVGRVVVPVTDQARARAFYVETLGFEVRGEFVMSPEYTRLEVAPAGAVTTLAIVPPPASRSRRPTSRPTTRR